MRSQQGQFWQRKAVVAVIAILITLLAGWSALRDIDPLFYLGLVGTIPLMLITGVHGGGTHVQNLIGGTLFAIVNFAFYYAVCSWLAKKWWGSERRKVSKHPQ
jgi:hypothetical protein